MNVQQRYKRLLSDHVNRWFSSDRVDGPPPVDSILQFNNEFLRHVKRLRVHLWCSEKEFRRYMCEALCTIYVASKQKTTWKGPLSAPKRPYGWTPTHETDWMDYVRNRLFTDDLWRAIWCHVPNENWEHAVPDWRDHFEFIATHYLMVHPDVLEDGMEDSEGHQSYGEDSD
jgi:hypothetical protein